MSQMEVLEALVILRQNRKKITGMSANDRIDKARELVYDYVKSDAVTAINHPTFSLDEVAIVWFSKTLKNWKAMVITTLPDQLYYEVTYKGENDGTDGPAAYYLDVYQKLDNIEFSEK